MKSMAIVWIVCLSVFTAAPLWSHHAAEDMVDEDVYDMIDSMVADTPHANLVFDSDPETGTTTISFTENVTGMEGLVEDGLIEYVEMLDGEVSITLDFDDSNRVDVFIEQIERLSE